MAQKYDLTDIGNALSRVMDNPMTKIIRSACICCYDFTTLRDRIYLYESGQALQ